MTPALKAMVEAMISEAARQDIAEAESAARQPWLADEPVTAEHQYDWAKVARAGLSVLKDVVIDAPEAEDVTVYGEPIGGAADAVFTLTIDAILKETP